MLLAADEIRLDLQLASEAHRTGRFDDALKIASSVLDRDPDSPEAMFIAAWGFIKAEKHGFAYNLLQRSLQKKIRYETLNNIAMCCLAMGRLEEAEEVLLRAIKVAEKAGQSPKSAYDNLALVSVYQCRPKRALEWGEKSLAIDPTGWTVLQSLGYANLMLGNFSDGWLGHEAIIGHAKERKLAPPHDQCPYWFGESNLNSLYLRGEQGVGDEIAFSSCLPDAIKDNPNIVFDCDEKLAGLFRRSFPQIEIQGTRRVHKPAWLQGRRFDAHALVGSLLPYYRKKAEDFPGKAYLVADPERRLQWRALLDTLPGLKVGIAWRGGLKNTFRKRRSMELVDMLPILRTPGVTFVSLDYDDPTLELEVLRETHGIDIKHWKRAAEAEDYDETAALVSELDLVISVCTATVHLAGALGKECWCLVPSKARWFYGVSGTRLPWYSSVELYRQTEKWPIQRVADRLAERAGQTEPLAA